MKLFKKLFGNRNSEYLENENSNDNLNQQKYAYSNFSENNLPIIQITLINNLSMDILNIISRIREKFQDRNIQFEIKELLHSSFYDNGLLKIPIRLKINDEGFSLFIIYDENDAKIFNTSIEIIKSTEYPNYLFFSNFNLTVYNQKSKYLNYLTFSDLNFIENNNVQGEFIMWASEEGDRIFHISKTRKYLDTIYENLNRYESYILGFLLSQIQMEGFEKIQRVSLPKNVKSILVNGPENKVIEISVSQEKGIRFHFQREFTTRLYRERFLEQISIIVKEINLMLISQQIQKDEKFEECGYNWYKFMTSVIEHKEKNDEINEEFVIGSVTHNLYY